MSFCPVWLGEMDSEEPLVVPRWNLWITDKLLDLAEGFEALRINMTMAVNPSYVPYFHLRVTGELKEPKIITVEVD